MLTTKKWTGIVSVGAILALVAISLAVYLTAKHRPGAPDRLATIPFGTWRAFESDPAFVQENNPCMVFIHSIGGHDIEVKVISANGDWQCDGRGSFQGPQISFKWKGPKGWSGSADITVSPDGKGFKGTYTRWDSKDTFHCKGHRIQ